MPKEIRLKGGGNLIVDDCDFDLICKFTWRFSERYVRRSTSIKSENGKWKAKYVSLHREIMNPVEGMSVDHINGNTLDNRRCNLRVCTHTENLRNQKKAKNNTSGFKGVSWNSRKKKWVAQVIVKKKRLLHKFFECPVEAAKAYNESVKIHFGEFARINEL